MNNKFVNVATFVIGAAVGSFVTWKYVTTKYEQRIQAEIDSVKEAFAAQTRPEIADEIDAEDEDEADPSEPPAPTPMRPSEKPSLSEYAKILNETGYTGEKGGSVVQPIKPYVIPPEEFGDEHDYTLVELRYFADKVLTDSWYNVIEDDEADDMIGLESLNEFGRYEEDSVHVRNDLKKTDYEVLLDIRKYSDIDLDDPDGIGR